MDAFERGLEIVGGFFTGLTGGVERIVTSLLGSSNAKMVRKLEKKVAAINALEEKYKSLSNDELRGLTGLFRKRLAVGETLDDLVVDAFAAARESGRRYLGMRHYDVQLVGGMILHGGNIAEMVTGEGKTLVATLPAYLNALSGKGVHVVTVNDYLARRDMEWMGPLYMGLGMTVGAIQNDMETLARQQAYDCDITYGTNNEFGFDYLRDNMKSAARGDNRFPKHAQQCQQKLHFAIIDEVDNILIDEARTPLIISGPAHGDTKRYALADKIARQLRTDVHFEVKEKERTTGLTEEGVRAAEKLAGVESFYTAGNMEWPHLIDNALKAHHLYKRDVNYVVQEGKVVIVDEFTGRLMPGRQWSDGLHQAVEAKEGVTIKEESQTMATITLQNFFKLYDKLCGMTGTGMTEANEFWKIYGLDVIAVPTNRQMQRINYPDVIYRTEREKFVAIADEIERYYKHDQMEAAGAFYVGDLLERTPEQVKFRTHDTEEILTFPPAKVRQIQLRGRPILVGTVSIEKSERLSELLKKRGVPHQVLNAKHHKREAEIVAQAGRLNAVTIATNMAGRGTDIVLGGNPETMAWAQLQDKYATRLDVPREEWDALIAEIEQREKMKEEGRKVAELGGLHVMGTERHEARRIDLQLRGRCGRQGDPGSSRFFLSLEDDLMRIFAGEWVKNVLTRLGMKDGEAIESGLVSRRIEAAQKKVEERNFDARKNLLEYDELMDEQRKRVYSFRQRILDGVNTRGILAEMIDRQLDLHVESYLSPTYGEETYAKWAGDVLATNFKAKDFRGVDQQTAEQVARDEAERSAERQIREAVEENLPEGDEEGWNWEALTKFVNSRWNLNFNDRTLRKFDRIDLADHLIEAAQESIRSANLADGAAFLDPTFGRREAIAWAANQFGIRLEWEEAAKLDGEGLKNKIRERAASMYAEKEAMCPVLASFHSLSALDGSGGKRLDRDALVQWAQSRFDIELSADDLRNKQREEIAELLLEQSRRHLERRDSVLQELQREATACWEERTRNHHGPNGSQGDAHKFPRWQALGERIRRELHSEWDVDLDEVDETELLNKVDAAVQDRYSPEMRKLERQLLLWLLDEKWKDHLLVMDHLKSSVGLRGYAQVDPKVEYKREGMRLFEEMWEKFSEQITQYVFRVERLSGDFVASTWSQGKAIHESPPSQAQQAQSTSNDELSVGGQSAQANQVQGEVKSQPIRNRGQRIGPNDPCPCGSGKKYKRCHRDADMASGRQV